MKMLVVVKLRPQGVEFKHKNLDFISGPLAVDAGLLLGLHVSVVAPCQDLPLLEVTGQRLCILLGEDVDDPWGEGRRGLNSLQLEHNHFSISSKKSLRDVTSCPKST